MKKLTALLLGTVMSIAFTTGAFADPLALAKSYFNSDDGRTGGYLGLAYTDGSIDDIQANYLRKGSNSTWALDDGSGGRVQFGFDFGKIRFDWRVGGIHSSVDSIDSAVLDSDASKEAAIAYSTLNFAIDVFRFELVKQKLPLINYANIAFTPYVGAGFGYGGGWMTGKKAGTGDVAEPAGHGYARTWEAGLLINLTDWAGITLGYDYLHIDLRGHNTASGGKLKTHMGTFGVRFTY